MTTFRLIKQTKCHYVHVSSNPDHLKGGWYLASVHLNHLEPAQSLHLVFNLLPQLVSLLCKVFWRRTCWSGNGSRKPFTPWSLSMSIYVNFGNDQRRVINCLPGFCWNLSAILLLLILIINTKAFGHREGRGEGAPWSLQPLPQRGTQLLMMLRRRQEDSGWVTGTRCPVVVITAEITYILKK